MMCVPLPCWGHVHIGFGNSLLASEGRMSAVGVRFTCPLCPKAVVFIVFGRAYCPIYEGVPSCLLAFVWHTLAFILVLYVCVVRIVGCSFFREKLLVKRLQGLFSAHLHHQEPHEPEPKALPTVFGHYVLPLSGGFKTSHNAIHKAEILQYST